MFLVAGCIRKPLSPVLYPTREFVDLVGGFNDSTPLKNILHIEMDHFHKCFRVNIQTKKHHKKKHLT